MERRLQRPCRRHTLRERDRRINLRSAGGDLVVMATNNGKLQLLAPLSGQVWPLERVPDSVFAQKMVGDGLSIDPVDAVLLAACDGEIVSVHPAGHAVTLRTPEGMELIMHVGIDTVMLKGEGFIPRVNAGDRVQAGAPLIQFDLD